jgi:hypothetical protein
MKSFKQFRIWNIWTDINFRYSLTCSMAVSICRDVIIVLDYRSHVCRLCGIANSVIKLKISVNNVMTAASDWSSPHITASYNDTILYRSKQKAQRKDRTWHQSLTPFYSSCNVWWMSSVSWHKLVNVNAWNFSRNLYMKHVYNTYTV